MDTIHPRAMYLEKGPFLVSVVLRAGREAGALGGAIRELQRQSAFLQRRMEVMVVGADEMEPVVAAFGGGEQIAFVKANTGETAAGARNRAIKKCRSDFLMFAEVGDRLATHAIETLARSLETHPDVAVAFGDAEGTAWTGAFSRERLFETDGIGPHPMWRRSLHQRLGFFDADVVFGSAYEFFLRVSARHAFLHIAEVLGERPGAGAADEVIASDAELDLWTREMATARERYWMNSWGEHPREKRVARSFALLRDRMTHFPPGMNVALFGAGKHTGRMLERFRGAIEPRHRLGVILDDRAEGGPMIGGVPVAPTGDWRSRGVEAVVVSSDAYEATMLSALRQATGGEVPVLAVYQPGPDHFQKSAAAAGGR